MQSNREIKIKTTYEIDIDDQLIVIDIDEVKELYDLLSKILKPEKTTLEETLQPDIYKNPGWEFPQYLADPCFGTCDGTTMVGKGNNPPLPTNDDFSAK